MSSDEVDLSTIQNEDWVKQIVQRITSTTTQFQRGMYIKTIEGKIKPNQFYDTIEKALGCPFIGKLDKCIVRYDTKGILIYNIPNSSRILKAYKAKSGAATIISLHEKNGELIWSREIGVDKLGYPNFYYLPDGTLLISSVTDISWIGIHDLATGDPIQRLYLKRSRYGSGVVIGTNGNILIHYSKYNENAYLIDYYDLFTRRNPNIKRA